VLSRPQLIIIFSIYLNENLLRLGIRWWIHWKVAHQSREIKLVTATYNSIVSRISLLLRRIEFSKISWDAMNRLPG
jgi:hypothetical protein